MESTQEYPVAPRQTRSFVLPALSSVNIRWEIVALVVIMLAAVVTRFYLLEPRVMSHDESLHTYYSWRLYQGQGYVHDPMMHGPLQFHLVSWAYFLLGDSDFSARVPAVLFGIASVAMVWAFRREIGRLAALIAAGLFVISPYMLYYSRYVRNEAFVVLFGLVGLWAILRYLNSGQKRYLLVLTASTALHFATKETAFIYTAQMLLFLGLLFLSRVTRREWSSSLYRNLFLVTLLVAGLLLGLAVAEVMFGGATVSGGEPTLAQPAVPGQSTGAELPPAAPAVLTLLPGILGMVALILSLFFLFRGVGQDYLRQERAFGLMLLLGTLVLPQLSPLPVRFMDWPIPDEPGEILTMSATDVMHFLYFIIPLTLIAVVIGLWWNRKQWLLNAALFYGIFFYLYTTGFTNPAGAISGLVGSLGYWVAQQGVQRGSQPWYYYLLVQIPLYEYLVFAGSLTAIVYFVRKQFRRRPEEDLAAAPAAEELHDSPDTDSQETQTETRETLALYLLVFWFISSLLAYTVAGEKMPWLTVHIALPMILLSGWGFAQLVQGLRWQGWRARRGWIILVILLVVLFSAASLLGSLLGMQPPFQSVQRDDLQATIRFLGTLGILALSVYGLYRLRSSWTNGELARLFGVLLVGLGALLTARTAFQASYVNYNEANEYLVYAHSASGVSDVMSRLHDLSIRTTDGLALQFAYDDDTSWPLTWYSRNYFNHRYYGNQPGKDLRELPAIVVGDNNFGAIEPVVGEAFFRFDYIRMVWPNQDYFSLNTERILDALTDPMIRAGLFQIWLNRDHSLYGEATGRSITLDNWTPADRMRLYIRKDVAAQLWDYATGDVPEEIVADPYEGGEIVLAAEQIIGLPGLEPGQFQNPRGLALAADGSLYVADSDNHRIQHLSPTGEVLRTWGSFADATAGEAPGGTFNQPWGVAVGPDGAVFVADTWNHRIQKFTPAGEYLTSWGYFGQAEVPEAFYGPRDVAVDSQGRVYVTDTGNKRVVVFDEDGNYLTEFGGPGLEPGQFDEPVGIDVDENGRIYVADTWNQRIQVFEELQGEFVPFQIWDVSAWYGASLENKPYISVNPDGQVLITDPEGRRVIRFDQQGQFVDYWGSVGSGPENFGLSSGIAAGEDGVWVADPGNDRLMYFVLP